MKMSLKNITLVVICLVLTFGIISAVPLLDTNNWNYRAELIVNGSMVQGNYSDFNVLLTEANVPSNFWENVQSSGCDVRFSTDENGANLLNFEAVNFNITTNTTEIWLNTSLKDGTDKTIYLWYGNNDISLLCSTTNVWDANYRGVWHLNKQGNGTAKEFKDSSDYSNDGQGGEGKINRVPTLIESKFGFGSEFNGDFINVFYNESLDTKRESFSINSWVRMNSDNNGGVIFSRSNSVGSRGFYVGIDKDLVYFKWKDGASWKNLGSNSSVFSDNQWHKITISVNSTSKEVFFYLDGDFKSNSTFRFGCSSSFMAGIGYSRPAGNSVRYGFNGSMDEIQFIVGEAFSDERVATEFDNQNTPELFVTNGTIVNLWEKPNVTGASPANDTSYTGSTLVNFTANVTDDFGLKNATLYVYDSTNVLIENYTETYLGNTTLEEFARNVTLGVGTYTWKIMVYDVFDNEYSTELRNLTINAIPVAPTSSSSSSSGGGGGSYCITKWTCDAWSPCVDGTQTRICSYPENYCEPTIEKPEESQSCIAINNLPDENEGGEGGNETIEEGGFAGITGAAIGFAKSGNGILSLIFIVLVAGGFIGVNVYRRKMAAGSKGKAKVKK